MEIGEKPDIRNGLYVQCAWERHLKVYRRRDITEFVYYGNRRFPGETNRLFKLSVTQSQASNSVI